MKSFKELLNESDIDVVKHYTKDELGNPDDHIEKLSKKYPNSGSILLHQHKNMKYKFHQKQWFDNQPSKYKDKYNLVKEYPVDSSNLFDHHGFLAKNHLNNIKIEKDRLK